MPLRLALPVHLVSTNALSPKFLRIAVVAIATFLSIPTLSAQSGLLLTTLTYDSGAPCPVSMVAADLNADGKPDLVIVNNQLDTILPDRCAGSLSTNGSIGVRLGNGDGTFKAATTLPSGGFAPISVQVADVNGDGKLDLIVANACSDASCTGGTIAVLFGNGDGTFRAPIVSNIQGVGCMTLSDVNRDGKPDLVLCSEFAVNVLLGNGDGTFQQPTSYLTGLGPVSSTISDVNHDGKPDLLLAVECGDDFCSSGLVAVLLGNGDGTFQTAVTYPSGGIDAISVAAADVNGDGSADLLVLNIAACSLACNTGSVGVLMGNGDGTFQPAVTYTTGAPAALAMAVGDLNGDGKLDLAVANCLSPSTTSRSGGCPSTRGLVGVLLGNGDGTFQAAATHSSGGIGASSIAITDVNSDSQPDIVVANLFGESNSDGTIGLLLHNNKSLSSTSTALASNLDPSAFGQQITLTATVTSTRGTIPNGELVTFFDSVIAIGTGNTQNGAATLATSSLSAGSHNIHAVYSGDSTFKPSAAPPISHLVSKEQTATALISSSNPSSSGQSVTFTATVTSTGSHMPTGKVTILDGTVRLKSVPLTNGVATLTDPRLAVGTHSITAEYDGDSSSATSTSPVLSQVVE